MLSGWRTIWYFGGRGLGYGVSLGALGGTLVSPLLGTFVGAFWGGGVGIILGIILGVAAHFYNRRAYRQQLDFETYQSNLTMGAGLAAAILSALPLFLVFAPIAALASAYVAHRYAEDNAQHIAKRKNESHIPAQTHMERPGVISQYVSTLLAKSKWILFPSSLLAAGVAFAAGAPFLPMSSLILQAIGFAITALLLGTLIVVIVGLANGVVIQFMNRLFFKQSMDKATYKRAIVAFSAVFTLLVSSVITLFFGAPIAALFAAWAAASYVDWYYESRPKLKREALLNQRLQETQRMDVQDDDMDAYVEDIEPEYDSTRWR